MTLLTEALKQGLSQLYDSPGRAYHNRSHVDALLALLQRHRAALADPDAVEAAIWFHDAVYDPRARDNEQRSAELCVAHLSGVAAAPRLARIRAMIEATATHAVPAAAAGDDEPGAAADAALFLDMDLSILGSSEARFDAYEAAVRVEYAWADDEAWRRGRAAVLASFLARPRIFYSELFYREYEEAARRNIQRSLVRLEG